MDNNNSLSLSICVLTYNRCSRLRDLLKELQAITYRSLEILVVDNHSEDDTQDMMRSTFPEVRYIRTEANIGAAGRNIAMKAAIGDVLVTLDDDIRGFGDNAIEILIRKFSEDCKLGAVNFGVITSEGDICNWVHHCKQEEFYDKDFLTYEITEGAVAFRRKALEQSGYYPETFFLSHEGPDLAFRIMESGFNVIYTGSVRLIHGFATEGREPWRNYYYDTRNQLWLAVRNFPIRYAMTYLVRGLFSMLVYSLRDGYASYWFKGIADGILGLRCAFKERRVLKNATMRNVKNIDSQRPSLAYMIKTRLLSKAAVNLK
jgi:GT2 family glycosyltransferase